MKTYITAGDTYYLVDSSNAKFRLKIKPDCYSESPREWSNVGTMVCWHRRYRLGDEHTHSEPLDFLQQLVRECVPEKRLVSYIRDGKCSSLRFAPDPENADVLWLEVYCKYTTVLGDTDPDWERCCSYPSKLIETHFTTEIIDNLSLSACLDLLEGYAAILPLFLYDHSGITMNTSGFHCPWDSGRVGWIYMSKETALRELCAYTLDQNGERIRVEHQHEGTPSTWSYKTQPLTDETWEARAEEALLGEVEVYDHYLRGAVYGYMLEKIIYESDVAEDGLREAPTGEAAAYIEVDSCYGFYGDTLEDSGILDQLGNELQLVS